jgi:hypothetical protein
MEPVETALPSAPIAPLCHKLRETFVDPYKSKRKGNDVLDLEFVTPLQVFDDAFCW